MTTMRRRRGALETAALIVLSVSFLLPVIGYLIGASLVFASSAWDDREKLTALLIPPAAVLAGGLIVTIGAPSVAEGDSSTFAPGPLEIAILLATFLSGVAAALYLAARLRRPRAG